MTSLLKYFEYDHLPVELQEVSKQMAAIAHSMEAKLHESPEKSAGMRKLLEAKDCFVRAAMEGLRRELG